MVFIGSSCWVTLSEIRTSQLNMLPFSSLDVQLLYSYLAPLLSNVLVWRYGDSWDGESIAWLVTYECGFLK